MRRRSDSTQKTHPCLIIPLFGPPTARPPAASRRRCGTCCDSEYETDASQQNGALGYWAVSEQVLPAIHHPITPLSHYPAVKPMPPVPVIMPQLGESIAEATVINLLVKVGDKVNADQDVIEVETNKATMNVASPCAGRVDKWLVNLNESYPVGAVLGYLEAGADDAARLGLDVAVAGGQKSGA